MREDIQDKIIFEVMQIEGGFVNDPRDSGGATKYGITEAVARANGYKGRMQDLPMQTAYDIYEKDYWNPLSLNSITRHGYDLCHELFDTGVNCGTGKSGAFLQRALNGFGYDLAVDGAIGRGTLTALNDFATKRGQDGIKQLVKLLNCLQGTFYLELTERRAKDKAFLFGWIKNRV